jgi:hypothetical protein
LDASPAVLCIDPPLRRFVSGFSLCLRKPQHHSMDEFENIVGLISSSAFATRGLEIFHALGKLCAP